MKVYNYPLKKLSEYEKVKSCLEAGKSCQVTGCSDSQLAHFIDGISDGYDKKVIVTFSAKKAQELYQDMRGFREDVVMYPSKDFIFFSADIHGNLITKQRLEFIEKLVEDKPFTVIITADALMDKILPLEKVKSNYIRITEGESIEITTLRKKLRNMGYEACERIESPGQYSVRGSIVDIYTLTDEVPYRIDFWDDEVDIIKSFDVESQRSIENIDEIKIYPASEYIIEAEEIEKGVEKIKRDLEEMEAKFRDDFKNEEAGRLKSITEEFLTGIEINPSGSIDGYVNYFCDETVSLYKYLEDAVFFIDEPKRVLEHMKAVELEFSESMKSRLEKGYVLKGQTDIIWDKESVLANLDSSKKVLFTTIAQKITKFSVDDFVEVEQRGLPNYSKRFDALVEDLKTYKKNGYSVLMVTGSKHRGERLAKDLHELGINAFYSDDKDREVQPKEIMITTGMLQKGFEYPMIKFVAISDSDIFGERKKKKKRKYKKGQAISSFEDLAVGDYVVHENRGVGIYRGIEKVEVDRVVKDYIKIEYAGGTNLYMLATQLDLIQKYADKDAKKVKVNKIGTGEWAKTKSRVKRAVEEIAEDLVKLYAIRREIKGYQFSPDTDWQREFEELFPFDETDDQLTAIRDVKADMESDKIMDRLICGDVGFGKTEVAIRAAFKAVQDSKQVAYLVPTTVLVQQHYKTFAQRFKDFPVKIEMLSRFRTQSNIRQTLSDLKKGYVDIVIGTHRMLSKDVEFKDLGLLIIDEEQRFGVRHKEKIKELKKNVDVMTLTATPIPRTLHMSLIGVRDFSMMEEAPQERLPIQTFVMEHDDEIVKEAINREIGRGGQVFYVYNKVADIAERASKVQALVPDAVVSFAHGQMSERELENIMYDFVNGDIDVLVCTTIIETGIDISNANTMIIHGADRMGLSQLYQLRGRVGRSNRTAYAFMMYQRGKLLTEVAQKRLGAIKNFTELGSGVKIAMRDLEIRGAGNLLGESQSGHMAEVGYDLYCKMLNTAIKTVRGEKVEEEFETKVDLLTDAYVPVNYINNETLKMDIYQRIAAIKTDEEYEDMQDELLDRFGEIPSQVENLMKIAIIKNRAHDYYITEISGNKNRIRIQMWEKAPIDPSRIPILVREFKGKLKFIPGNQTFEYEPNKGVKKDDGIKNDVISRADHVVDSMSTLLG